MCLIYLFDCAPFQYHLKEDLRCFHIIIITNSLFKEDQVVFIV